MSKRKASPKPTRVLIIDDHPVMRRGLSHVINSLAEMEICGEAATVAEAREKIDQTRPDMLVVDISLGDGNGIDLIKDVKARHPGIKMLVSSMHDESLFAERAIRAGALGYINKHEDTDALIEALKRVHEGRIYLSPQMTDYMLHQMVTAGEEPPGSPIEKLSDRELEVFEMIGRGMTTKQIASRLDLSPKTVETYRENIKSKLNLQSGAELTRHAVQWVLQGS